MVSQAGGTFDVDSWEDGETVREDEGTKQTRVRVGKTFHGDLVGTSSTELITVEGADGGPLAYVGVETVRGILHGREGTFVLQHSAGSDDGTLETQWLRWQVVPGSGTGELAGIRGEGEITVGPEGTHSWKLDYTLG